MKISFMRVEPYCWVQPLFKYENNHFLVEQPDWLFIEKSPSLQYDKYSSKVMEKEDKQLLSQILKKMIVKYNPFVVNPFCLIVAVCF